MTPVANVSVLFASEGDLGGRVLGHVAIANALRDGLEPVPDIDARWVRLPHMARSTGLLAAEVPGLNGLDLDLKIVRWHGVQAVRMRRLVRAALRERPVDVLHVDSHTVSFGLLDVMRETPTLLCVDATVAQWQRQGLWHTRRRWSGATIAPSVAFERRAFERAYAVVAMSEWSAAGVREVAPKARIEVIHPGVDTDRFSPAPLEPRSLFRLLFVGGRFTEKGGDDLLDAIGNDLGRTVELDVVTNADLEPRHGMRVHRLGYGDPRLISLFRQADLLVLPTHADAVPLVLPEAMACGTPVLVSDVAALPDLAGDAGFVVPSRRPDLLRAQIEAVVGAGSTRSELRVKARRRAESHFAVRSQGERMAALIREAARS